MGGGACPETSAAGLLRNNSAANVSLSCLCHIDARFIHILPSVPFDIFILNKVH